MFKIPRFTKSQFLAGCSTAVIAFAVTTIILFMMVLKKAEKFISDTPRAIPVAEAQPADMEPVRNRLDRFVGEVDRGIRTEVELTAEEINALIATQPELEPWRGKLYIQSITTDSVLVNVSLPMQQVGMTHERMQGKFINADLHVIAGIHNNDLKINLVGVENEGESAPGVVVDQFSAMLDPKKMREQQPQIGPYLDRIEILELRDGRIRIGLAPALQ